MSTDAPHWRSISTDCRTTGVSGLVVGAGFDVDNFIDDVLTGNNFTKNGVFAV